MDFPLQSEGNNLELYEILQCECDASADELKRQYRRLALQYHPDKNQSAEAGAQFQKINAAWDVLGNEKLRRIYDQHGQFGVDMYNQMGESASFLLDPESQGLLLTLLCVVSVLLLILLLFPIFVVLKADGHVQWNWAVVFIPIWILDVVGGIFVFARYFGSQDQDESLQTDYEDSEVVNMQQQNTYNGVDQDCLDFDSDNAQPQHQQQESFLFNRLSSKKVLESILAWKRLIQYVLFCVFQILIVIKLENSGAMSWAVVFVPWFVLEGIHFVESLLTLWQSLEFGHLNSMREKFITASLRVINTFKYQVLRIVLAILIVRQADQQFTNWAVVFIPLYLMCAIALLSPWIQYRLRAGHLPQRERISIKRFVTFITIIVAIGCIFALAVIGMLIQRLNNLLSTGPGFQYAVGTIMIPVFVLFGIVLCCSCCIFPCMLCCMLMVGELNAEQELRMKNGPWFNSARRIMYTEEWQSSTQSALNQV
ncbi:hypothetical protein MIR68_011363 [Amoeboaphelidium protococcarum]|nr:hypothetical protein MIR68_011363 [Amoeboaphelidium protococcarum]